MSSKSSSERSVDPLPIGPVKGHRGNSGELTVRVLSGDGERWLHLSEVLIERVPGQRRKSFSVASSRAYRDRLVLKLETVDNPGDAEDLRGAMVLAPSEQVPELPEGRFYLDRLIGLEARDEDDETIGTVEDVLEAGGSETLVIRERDGEELLVPLVGEYVREVDEKRIALRSIRLLRGLNITEAGE